MNTSDKIMSHSTCVSRLVFCCVYMWLVGLNASEEGNAQRATHAEGELPLPKWSEHEIRAFRGNSLIDSTPSVLPPEGNGPALDISELLNKPLDSGPRLDRLFDQSTSVIPPRLRPQDMTLFLPESLLTHTERSQPDRSMPTPISSLRSVAPEFLTTSEKALPSDYLIDPDLLVAEMQQHDLMRFLEFHAKDARIKLYLLILARDRCLPETVRLDKTASGALLQEDSCLVVYPLGEPWRARLFVSKPVHDQTSSKFLGETIQACLQDAMQASDVYDQLHRYAVQLSTRLFWLQRALASDPKKSSPPMGQPLSEISPAESTAAAQVGKDSFVSVTLGCIAGLLAIAGITGVGRRVIRYQRQRSQMRVWILPETETFPRLGGAFSGGGGGTIQYS